MTKSLTHAQRLERVGTMHAEGRLIRQEWRAVDSQGREMACFLSALVPGSTGKCPASLMPSWAAEMLPNIDDNVAENEWPRIAGRFVEFAEYLPRIEKNGWRKAMLKTNLCSLEIALPYDKHDVVQPVISLIKRELDGDKPLKKEWNSAKSAASAAASAEAAAAPKAAASAAAAWKKIADAFFDATKEVSGAAK
jgi:hypothetical protein